MNQPVYLSSSEDGEIRPGSVLDPIVISSAEEDTYSVVKIEPVETDKRRTDIDDSTVVSDNIR